MFSKLSKIVVAIPARPRAVLYAFLFLAAWAFLNANFNLRIPARPLQGGPYYLLPSIDVVFLLTIFALLGWWGRRPMIGVTIGIAVLATFIRAYRMADGFIHTNYYREIQLYLDAPMLPELWRLLRLTLPLPTLLLWVLVLLASMVALIVLSVAALIYTQDYLARGWRERGVFAGVLAVCTVLTPLWPAVGEQVDVRRGLFNHSLVPKGIAEVQYAISADHLRRKKVLEIRLIQEQLLGTPSNLERLKGADFLLFLVESYGSAVFRQRSMSGTGCPALEEFTRSVGQRGFHTASKLINSITYGGGSWYAHTTLRTGVKVRNPLEYGLMLHRSRPPLTMAQLFRQAGYRTVLAQPGTVRPWPEGLVHGFDRRYYAFHMDYEGPAFGFASMPDQYLLHAIHGKEMEGAKSPMFVEYGLVSSHVPWTPVPVAIEDWSKLDRGRIFKTSTGVQFPVSWMNMENGAVAYSYSLCYDFDIMRRYITERMTRNSFIVILGDHQPPGAITFDDPSWAVPLHVLSKDRELIEDFIAAGYTPGMIPASSEQNIGGMDGFLTHMLTMLSSGRSTALQR